MNSLKSCFSTGLTIFILLGFLFWDDLKREGWLEWNTNWFLEGDYDHKANPPRPRTDIVVSDYLPGGHYYKAENWRDPRVRDEAEVTFNAMISAAGLPAQFHLRPWREAMKRNSRYDLRRQVELLVEIDRGMTAANQSGGRFEAFANLAVFGAAVYAGTRSDNPYGTARDTARLGRSAVPSASGFWTEQKAKAEMRQLARTVFLPSKYGSKLDPTHPMTDYLESFRSGAR
ncbi:MAG: hypothetical protein KDN20_24705 [Verrucomicrobiae bacterium]|nr:hypothetical protein [Verrucomicrobiae bacterium]